MKTQMKVVAANGETYVATSSAVLPGVWYIDVQGQGGRNTVSMRLFGRVQHGETEAYFISKLDGQEGVWPKCSR